MGKRFILTTNKRGQVTLPKEGMEHFGLPSGGKLKLEFLSGWICRFSPIHPRSRAKAPQNPPSSSPDSTCTAPEEAQ
jgi:bifunctional DNA-binding transcriptional regulator/antitoxin component of YhaV-PrlF toxin-antitoxin module